MRINLLPQEFRPQPLVSPTRLLVMIIGSILVIGSVVGVIYQVFQLKMEEDTLANVTAQLEVRKASMAEVAEIEAKLQEITKRQDEIKKIMETYPEYPVLIKVIAGALKNSDIWLTDTTMASDGIFKITGKTIVFPVIGDFLKKLTESGIYQSARLTDVTEEKEKDKFNTVYTFNIEVATGEGAPQYADQEN